MISPTFANYDGDQLVAEMIRNRLENVKSEYRLHHNDFRRIAHYISQSIFLPNSCTLWQGYVTDRTKTRKGIYINFYFRKRKIALHRLLYINFLGPLEDNEYVRFKCGNKGKCCNINCLEKRRYSACSHACEGEHEVYHTSSTFLDNILNVSFI